MPLEAGRGAVAGAIVGMAVVVAGPIIGAGAVLYAVGSASGTV